MESLFFCVVVWFGTFAIPTAAFAGKLANASLGARPRRVWMTWFKRFSAFAFSDRGLFFATAYVCVLFPLAFSPVFTLLSLPRPLFSRRLV